MQKTGSFVLNLEFTSNYLDDSFSALHCGRLTRTTCCERPLNSCVTQSAIWWVNAVLSMYSFIPSLFT